MPLYRLYRQDRIVSVTFGGSVGIVDDEVQRYPVDVNSIWLQVPEIANKTNIAEQNQAIGANIAEQNQAIGANTVEQNLAVGAVAELLRLLVQREEQAEERR